MFNARISQIIDRMLHGMPALAFVTKNSTGGMHTALEGSNQIHGSQGCNVRARSQMKRRIHNRQTDIYPKR